MTLPSAPASIGVDQINAELGFSPTACGPINDAPYRSLAGLPTPSGQISWSDFYGKSAVFGAIANCYCGGWYMGCTTTSNGCIYYLVAAPATPGYQFDFIRTGCPQVCQNLPVFSPGPIGCNPTSSYDGYCLTKFIQTCPNYTPVPVSAPLGYTYPLIAKINALTINGYADWYFPAATEDATMFCNADLAWRCGGPMKTTGNQYSVCISQFGPAPNAYAPGAWPYLGYITGCNAPGATGFGTGWNCNNGGWPSTGSTQYQAYPVCTSITTNQYAAITQASGNPQGTMPTSCGLLIIGWDKRFWCSGATPCGGTNVWPMPVTFCSNQRCAQIATRAVRRVLKA
jgi:hypothetical protein